MKTLSHLNLVARQRATAKRVVQSVLTKLVPAVLSIIRSARPTSPVSVKAYKINRQHPIEPSSHNKSKNCCLVWSTNNTPPSCAHMTLPRFHSKPFRPRLHDKIKAEYPKHKWVDTACQTKRQVKVLNPPTKHKAQHKQPPKYKHEPPSYRQVESKQAAGMQAGSRQVFTACNLRDARSAAQGTRLDWLARNHCTNQQHSPLCLHMSHMFLSRSHTEHHLLTHPL
jgi:hypothetical protein